MIKDNYWNVDDSRSLREKKMTIYMSSEGTDFTDPLERNAKLSQSKNILNYSSSLQSSVCALSISSNIS